VVPNEQASIYTRLWCVYEAFLAYELDKVILTAMSPLTRREWVEEIACLALAFGAGALLVSTADGAPLLVSTADGALLHTIFIANMLCVKVLFVVSTVCAQSAVRQAANLLGLVMGASIYYIVTRNCHDGHCKFDWMTDDSVTGIRASHDRWTSILTDDALRTITFFVTADFDRLRWLGATRQASQLERRYTSVLEAGCSDAIDEDNLLREISGRTTQVDDAIRVLIMAGMSTSSLREASKLGVDVKGAAFIEYSFPMLLLGVSMSGGWKLQKVWLDGTTDNVDLFFFGVNIADKVLALLFFLYFFWTPPDARVFAYRVVQKGGLLVAMVPLMVAQLLQLTGAISYWGLELNLWTTSLLVWLIVIPISMARIHRIAKIPRIGPTVASFLAIRGVIVLRMLHRWRTKTAGRSTGASTSEEEESASSSAAESTLE